VELIWLDDKGQITLDPAHLRHLGAAEGDWLTLEVRSDGAFVLRRRADGPDPGHLNERREEGDPAAERGE
jgi:bifunctional DNA-binding transcriptional regulator/antitoxin component of YhaV-PrlF toxin-antitoxin module